MKVEMHFTASNIATFFCGQLDWKSSEQLNDPLSNFPHRNLVEKIIDWFSPPRVENVIVSINYPSEMSHVYTYLKLTFDTKSSIKSDGRPISVHALENPTTSNMLSAAKCIENAMNAEHKEAFLSGCLSGLNFRRLVS